jgi:segregation and condensation protein B
MGDTSEDEKEGRGRTLEDGNRTTDVGRQTTDGGPQTADGRFEWSDDGDPPEAAAEENPVAPDDDLAVEAATELEMTEVDPLVRVELARMVEDVGALVEPTFEAEASAEMEPVEAPTTVEAELQREDLETRAAEAAASPVPVSGEHLTAEAEAAVLAEPEPVPSQERPLEEEAPGEKPRKRGRREHVPGEGEGGGLRDGTLLSLTARVESLLFVADGAVPVSRLAEALEVPSRAVEQALADLQASYQQRGLSVQRFRDRVQLTTAPAAAPLVERFLGLAASTPLSRAALEALAIIAYQQPVTRPQIEAVRGVNSDSVIKNLLTKGLIEESGRAEGPGRPLLYSTTTEFMQHFGLNALSDLPPLTPPGVEPGETISELLKG